MEPLALLFALDGDNKAGGALDLLPDLTGVPDGGRGRKSCADDPDAWIALRTGTQTAETVEFNRLAWPDEREFGRAEAA